MESVANNARGSFEDFPEEDSDWTADRWKALLCHLVDSGFATWTEVCSLVLGHLNPSQVGTSIASKASFQRHFEKGKTWRAVRQWHFLQSGVCDDCGTRLELQADHIVPKEIVGEVGQEFSEEGFDDRSELLGAVESRLSEKLAASKYENEADNELLLAISEDLCDAILEGEIEDEKALREIADHLENMTLRCRRCNVIRRPSHRHGGETFLTTEAALMWILLVKRPDTYEEFEEECRSYGMTMANIRFQEAWAMARWLERNGDYLIDETSNFGPES